LPQSLASAAPPDWSTVDTVLLDLDGTLLDLAFDNFVWMARIPAISTGDDVRDFFAKHGQGMRGSKRGVGLRTTWAPLVGGGPMRGCGGGDGGGDGGLFVRPSPLVHGSS
jgi:hypothetical protein